jgi:hypothetical protein
MKKWRDVVGLLASLMLLLSSGAHSLLGWKSMQARVEAFRLPDDLVLGLRIGWQFGGACMLAFGILTAGVFLARWRGDAVSSFPVIVTGVLWLAFGAWAMVISGNPFFTIFIVPGVLFLIASLPGR